jgi:group II intron reverse transcriptase/maturase
MDVCTRQQRLAELARQSPQMAFTSLNHHLDLEWLREAHRRTRKDSAPGVDGETAAQFALDLDGRLAELLERAKSGRYVAPPVKRAHIPKGPGETRPIGMPTFENKVLERAVAMVLEPIYEQDFLDCSYGFRPGRSCHQALEALWRAVMSMGGCWLIDADISKFFDTLDKGHLRTMLDRRVRDGVIRRLIGKWLSAGVLEAGAVWYPERGTPQGGVISPLLSNIYLHEVLDTWFERDVRPCLQGRAFLIRYADDFVMGFEREDDARRVLAVLPKRFARFGLTIHPEKTRLLEFRPPARSGPKAPSFNFLGFTHHWAVSRRGRPYVQRQTRKERLVRSLRAIGDWCREHRHQPLHAQWQHLRAAMRGHYGYYGITGNGRRLRDYYEAAKRLWHKWLDRRSNRRDLSWERFQRLLDRYPLPLPQVVHSVHRAASCVS